MAVRFGSAGTSSEFFRSANIPATLAGPFTVCGWATPTARADYTMLFALELAEAGGLWFQLGFDGVGGAFKNYNSTTGETNSGFTPTAGVPFFWACVVSGSGIGQIKLLARSAAGNTLTTAVTVTDGPTFVPERLFIGSDSYDEFYDGRVWNVKFWDRTLTDAELLIESFYARVMFPTSVNFHWPMFNAADTRDISGNGRDASISGTVTTEDGAHGLWRPRRRIFLPAPSVGPGSQTITCSGVASLEALGTLTIANVAARALSLSGIASNEAFGTAVLANVAARAIAASAIASLEAFGSGSLSHLEQTILAAAIDTAETFGDHTIAVNAQPIAASGVASSEAFGTTVVANVAAQSISVSGIASGEALGTLTLANVAARAITATGIASDEAFGTTSIADVVLDITATGIVSAEAFGDHNVAGENLDFITPSAISSLEAFGTLVASNVVAQAITASGVGSAEAFGTATLAVAAQTIVPTGIASLEGFGDATLNFTLQTISPTGIASAAIFGSATLTGGVVTEPSDGKMFISVFQPIFVAVWKDVTRS